MQTITTIGLDIAKSVFQVHGVDAAGEVVIRRQLKRRSVLAFFQKLPPCLVGTLRLFGEAVTRANMRFVPTKTLEQQSCLMLHRTRHLFIRQQTAVINSIRAHLAEFGIVATVGRKGVTELLHVVADPSDKRVPEVGRACLAALGDQLLGLKRQILEFDRMIMAWHRSTRRASAFITFPGSGRRSSSSKPYWERRLLSQAMIVRSVLFC